ncbi:sulfide dehydrogenase (flavoprotein) subunit SudB [Alkalispirochaeta americana]|uniref:Sulfide dehydrogenase (Flavoprotein) subunit SudB n=1 Tax=Alkalispirochaeta americana TaxID=159291 RepID=A0A1N6Q847_9SPIO|nr:sulfide/dihydroorotate dehydrogenase-like FAD/NAD-binding protein [Alkalispirochaeta americana]SIQ12824.1 sulfide dehydrogenase (flavoprotein) subunit SudB [Alkalispirochaeta americana]
MHTLIKKEQLSEQVYRFELQAPLIAQGRKPGQFVLVQTDLEFGERIPLTIADANPEAGTITLIFQAVGATTQKLATLQEGQAIPAILGPLGQPSHIERVGHVVCVCGGIGAAPMYPIAQELRRLGNRLTVIVGARSAELLILEDELRALADDLLVVTDDGSAGRKALVTEPLEELCRESTPPVDQVFVIGPPIMMKFAAETTRPFAIPTVVSLNTIMVDGTGMCGGCRVTIGEETRFVCVDGPEFDGHLVDFDNMMKRLQSYKHQEANARDICRQGGTP